MKHFLLPMIIFLAFSCSLQAQNWSLTGNAGTNPTTQFLGTTDAKSLVFKLNNIRYGILDVSTTSIISFGKNALVSNTTGSSNVSIGPNSLTLNTTGGKNVGIGASTLQKNTTSSQNTAVGHFALSECTGALNTGVGNGALGSMTTSSWNTAVGANALAQVTNGQYVTAIGYNAGVTYNNTRTTFLGALAQPSAAIGPMDNSTVIGYNTIGTSHNQVRIGNSSVLTVGGPVNWTSFSDGRFKMNRQQNVPGLSFINGLTPLTYNIDATKLSEHLGEMRDSAHLKSLTNREKIVYSGFIAQDVENLAKKLGYDFSGVDAPDNEHGVYGLRYGDFVVPLVQAVQELSAQNEEMKTEIEQIKSEIASLKSDLERMNKLSVENQSGGSLGAPTLGQNIPNPFSESTLIPFHLPENCKDAAIMIVDLTGKSIVKFVQVSCLETSLQVETSTLSSGTYSYTLYVNGSPVDSKKMIVTR